MEIKKLDHDMSFSLLDHPEKVNGKLTVEYTNSEALTLFELLDAIKLEYREIEERNRY